MDNNKFIISQVKHFKSLRAAAMSTGNKSEAQRCSDIIEALNAHYVIRGGGKYV